MLQSLSQDPIGPKCIECLGQPKKKYKDIKKGWQGEVIAFNKLARLGYDVRFEKPCHYDFTIHGEKGIARIQVKTFTEVYIHNRLKKQLNVKKTGDNQTKEPYLLTDFDFLAAVDVETEEVFLVPIREIESKRYPGRTKVGITKLKVSSYKI